MSKFVFLKSLRELLTPLKRLIDKKAENINWNENDPSSNSYIAGRTHYKEEKKVFYLNNVKLFFENTTENIYISSEISALNGNIGDIFVIVWDKVEYQCKVSSLNGTYVLGNQSILSEMFDAELPNTGEPFLYAFQPGMFRGIYTLDTSESHTVSCYDVSTVVHKIPFEYLDLPHDLITKSELASVAISGSYEDLSDTPDLNFVPYDSTVTVSNYQKKIARENIGLNEIDYNKLQNKPVGDLFYEQVTFNNLISESVSFDPSIIFERKNYLISYTATSNNGSTYTYSNVELNFNAQRSTDTYYVYNFDYSTLGVSLLSHTISITQWSSLFKEINLSIEDLKIERTVQLNEKFIPDTIARTVNTISSPAIASVGQTLVVKSVDENGKPTEWETIDPWIITSPNGTQFKLTIDDEGTLSATELT